MSELISLHCPKCGRSLTFNPTEETLFCNYCGAKLLNKNGGLINIKDNRTEDVPNITKAPEKEAMEKKQKPKRKIQWKRGLFVLCLLVAMTAISLMIPGVPVSVANAGAVIGGVAVAAAVTLLVSSKRIWFMAVPLVLMALTFYALPVEQIRAVWVIAFASLTIVATLITIVVLIWRVSHHTRVVGLIVGLVIILVFEAAAGFGLNAYADYKTTQAISLIKDYYTSLALDVEEGNELSTGYSLNVTYKDIANNAEAVSVALIGWNDTPAELIDYASKVKAWALDIQSAAGAASIESAHRSNYLWGVPSPASFKLVMSSDQLDAVFQTTEQNIANEMRYGDYAFATNNGDELLSIEARLEAESYWLAGISTSTDSNWIMSHLRFIEPVIFPTPDFQAAQLDNAELPSLTKGQSSSIELVAYVKNTSEFSSPLGHGASRSSAASLEVFTSRASEAATLGRLNTLSCPTHNCAYPNFAPSLPTQYENAQSDWEALKAQMPPLMGSDVSWPEAIPTPPMNPSQRHGDAPKPFKDSCDTIAGTISPRFGEGSAADTQRVPSNEDGWICHAFNSPCWTLLTYSGATYAGGEAGKCPESPNLNPDPGGPVGEFIHQATGSIGLDNLPGLNLQPVVPISPNWNGTYKITKSSLSCAGVDIGMWGEGQSFVVSSNSIVTAIGGNTPIDSGGRAEVSDTGKDSSLHYTFLFSETGGSVNFTGNVSGSIQGMSCSGSFDGTRISP